MYDMVSIAQMCVVMCLYLHNGVFGIAECTVAALGNV
jgi:hypothetical protein